MLEYIINIFKSNDFRGSKAFDWLALYSTCGGRDYFMCKYKLAIQMLILVRLDMVRGC